MGFLFFVQSRVCDLRKNFDERPRTHSETIIPIVVFYLPIEMRVHSCIGIFVSGDANSKWKSAEKKSDFVIFDRNGNWRVWTFRVTSFFCYLYFFRSCTRKVHPLAAKSCQISIRSTIVQQSLSKDSTQWSPTLELQFVFINILFIYMRVISTRSHKRSWIN